MSEILRSRWECAYCGWNANTADHIPAIAMYWLGDRKRRRPRTNCRNSVPACSECNTLLNAAYLVTLQERAEYLTEKYERRYSKLLAQPVWGEEEIESLGPSMQAFIQAKGTERQILMDRLAHLGTIARFGALTVDEYWERVMG